MLRFDKFQREREEKLGGGEAIPEPAPTTNGTAAVKHETEPEEASEPTSPTKRKAPTVEAEDEDDDLSSVIDASPPAAKKVKKTPKTKAETDEEIAARLQAELNAPSARSTRGAGTTKKKSKPVVKKSKSPKKKSKAKIGSDVDSDMSSGEKEKPERERKGGFHVRPYPPLTLSPFTNILLLSQKPMILSEPLSAMLNESALSRPQTVKKIWEYVKERDLQDPNDKRQIRCDDAMRAVFKQERVHMFTMNKLLASHLYAQDE